MNYLLLFIVTLFLSSCGSSSSSSNHSGDAKSYIAYLIDSKVNGVQYYCDNNKFLANTGEQKNSQNELLFGSLKVNPDDCNYIYFKLGNLTIGKIAENHINDDKKIFIGEILELSRTNTNDNHLISVLRLIQTLDNDQIFDNGISIDKNISDKLLSHNIDFTNKNNIISDSNLENIINDTYPSRTLISKQEALVHYDNVLRDEANLSVDSVAPMVPSLKNKLISSSRINTEEIIVLGEENTKLIVNNIYTNQILSLQGESIYTLDVSGDDNTFVDVNISLQDNPGSLNSIPLKLHIYKDYNAPIWNNYNNPHNISYNRSLNNTLVNTLDISDSSMDHNITLDYEISGTDSNLFTIDNINNKLHFNNIPQSGSGPYFLSIKAIDKASHPSDTIINLQITILN